MSYASSTPPQKAAHPVPPSNDSNSVPSKAKNTVKALEQLAQHPFPHRGGLQIGPRYSLEKRFEMKKESPNSNSQRPIPPGELAKLLETYS